MSVFHPLSCDVWRYELEHVWGYPEFPKCRTGLNDFRGSHQRSKWWWERAPLRDAGDLEKSHVHFTDVTEVLSQSLDVSVATLGESEMTWVWFTSVCQGVFLHNSRGRSAFSRCLANANRMFRKRLYPTANCIKIHLGKITQKNFSSYCRLIPGISFHGMSTISKHFPQGILSMGRKCPEVNR